MGNKNRPLDITLTIQYDYNITILIKRRSNYEFFERNVQVMKVSSKRFVGFAKIFMLICSWGGSTFTAFEVKDKILDCFMYISVVGLGVTAAEKFGKK